MGAVAHGRARTTDDETDDETLAEQVAGQLLARWGVVFWDLMARESLALPWREVVWALRRLEARGIVRGGRFVTGPAGEQYALPEAVEELRRVRRTERAGQTVRLNGADPLNLVGIVLPGPRVAAVRTNSITYRDGAAVPDDGVTDARRGARPCLVGLDLGLNDGAARTAPSRRPLAAPPSWPPCASRPSPSAARCVRTGMGHVRAHAAAQTLASRIEPGAAVVLAGISGGLDPALAPGEIVVATSVRGPDGDELDLSAPTPPRWRPSCAGAGRRVHLGPIVSSKTLVHGERRAELARTGALAVDMESAWVARALSGHRLVIVRLVADTAGNFVVGLVKGLVALRHVRAARRSLARNAHTRRRVTVATVPGVGLTVVFPPRTFPVRLRARSNPGAGPRPGEPRSAPSRPLLAQPRLSRIGSTGVGAAAPRVPSDVPRRPVT